MWYNLHQWKNEYLSVYRMEKRPGGSASREGSAYPDVSRPPRVLNQPDKLVGSTEKIIILLCHRESHSTFLDGSHVWLRIFCCWIFRLWGVCVCVHVCISEGNIAYHLPCLFDIDSHKILDSPMMLSWLASSPPGTLLSLPCQHSSPPGF